jgi:hypothetical protein
MICTLHRGLRHLDNKVNVLEKNARKLKMLKHMRLPTFVLCLPLTLKIKITFRREV